MVKAGAVSLLGMCIQFLVPKVSALEGEYMYIIVATVFAYVLHLFSFLKMHTRMLALLSSLRQTSAAGAAVSFRFIDTIPEIWRPRWRLECVCRASTGIASMTETSEP